jgi:hypothetical protein
VWAVRLLLRSRHRGDEHRHRQLRRVLDPLERPEVTEAVEVEAEVELVVRWWRCGRWRAAYRLTSIAHIVARRRQTEPTYAERWASGVGST